MEPKVSKRSYREIESIFDSRRDSISQKYSGRIVTFQDTMELLFYLNDILHIRFFEDYNKTGKQLDGPKAMIPILFFRNNHYLIAAHKLVSVFGLINPCYLNLRAVFEGIMQIYLLHLTGREAELFYKEQIDILTPADKKEYKDQYERLKPAKVRNILYTDTKKQQIDNFYKEISNSAHASIKSAMSDFIPRDVSIDDALNLTLGLSAANIVAIHETYFDNFNKEELDEISNTLDNIAKELGGIMIDMIPNNPTFKEKLKIIL